MAKMPQPAHGATHSLDATGKDTGRDGKPMLQPEGGPIMPKKQGYVNPGPTPNLRGVEPNTARHKGFPIPTDQPGDPGEIGTQREHNPGRGESGNHRGGGVPMPVKRVQGRHSDVSTKVGVPSPGHSVHENGAKP